MLLSVSNKNIMIVILSAQSTHICQFKELRSSINSMTSDIAILKT